MGKGRAVSIVLDDPERQELQKLTRKQSAKRFCLRTLEDRETIKRTSDSGH
jgi:hypothetical protein